MTIKINEVLLAFETNRHYTEIFFFYFIIILLIINLCQTNYPFSEGLESRVSFLCESFQYFSYLYKLIVTQSIMGSREDQDYKTF